MKLAFRIYCCFQQLHFFYTILIVFYLSFNSFYWYREKSISLYIEFLM
jgi:hypothetical protein